MTALIALTMAIIPTKSAIEAIMTFAHSLAGLTSTGFVTKKRGFLQIPAQSYFVSMLLRKSNPPL